MAKVFLVDDDPLIVRMYQKKLMNDGYEVETAGDGAEAWDKLQNFKADLILLDMMMPKMNGLELLEKLKGSKDWKKVPVVMLTNVGGSQADMDRALELGSAAYLIKADHRPADVVLKVKEVLAD